MTSRDAPDDPSIGRMHFDRMDDGTDADFEVLKRVHQHNLLVLPDLLLGLLTDMRADVAYPVDRLDHSLQTATRAQRDGADEELIVCALLHDIGESLGPTRPMRPNRSRPSNPWCAGCSIVRGSHRHRRHRP